MKENEKSCQDESDERFLLMMQSRLLKQHRKVLEEVPDLPECIKNATFDELTMEDVRNMREIKTLEELIDEVTEELNKPDEGGNGNG